MKKDKELLKIVRELSKECFVDSKLVESKVTRAIKTLKALPRTKAIFAITELIKYLKRKEREHTLIIETTIPLSPSQITKFKKIAEKKNKITKVLVNINPEILGGFKLRVGDEIWDETLTGKIEQVKEAIRG